MELNFGSAMLIAMGAVIGWKIGKVIWDTITELLIRVVKVMFKVMSNSKDPDIQQVAKKYGIFVEDEDNERPTNKIGFQ